MLSGLVGILYTIAVVLVVIWIIGLVFHILGGAIHILLVLAVIIIAYNLLFGNRSVAGRR